MCTVSFIPAGKKFYITSNRDESPARRAKHLNSSHSPGGGSIYYPLDESSGGSWIALDDQGKSVCLLNGAFESFTPKPAYRKSRGQVTIDAIQEEIDYFLYYYRLEDIAPFTIIIFENSNLFQLIWDGEKRFVSQLSAEMPHIWSSVTLYPPEIRKRRSELFTLWLQKQVDFNRESILQFHKMTNGDLENDFIMNRNEMVKTLSITSIVIEESKASILHLELDKEVHEEILVRYE